MKDSNKLVSVIICGYNAGKFLEQAIQSVLDQTYTDFELLLIDDGSTDDSKAIMESYLAKDARVKVYSHTNMGMAASVNKIVPLTNSEIIFRLDADDIMYPNRIKEQLDYLIIHQDIGGLSCLGDYIDEDNKCIGKTYSDILSIADCKKNLQNDEIVGFLHPGFVFRKQLFFNVGGYDGKFWPAEDVDLCNKFIEHGYWIITYPKVLVGYRIHSNSVITSKFMHSRNQYEWLRACIRARRKALPQPTVEEFMQQKSAKGLVFKLNNLRKNYSKFYYRTAGFNYASKKYALFALKLGLALVLQPSLVIKKLVAQKGK